MANLSGQDFSNRDIMPNRDAPLVHQSEARRSIGLTRHFMI